MARRDGGGGESERILVTEPEDKNRVETLVSEIRNEAATRAGSRIAVAVINSKLAELIAALWHQASLLSGESNILSEKSNELQKWMVRLTIMIGVLTFFLIILTVVLVILAYPNFP